MNEVRNEGNVDPTTYSHQKALCEIDDMNKQLDQLKEDVFKATVQAHVLHVDLATQFSPYMVEKLRTVKEDCSNCSNVVNMLDKSETE